MRGHGKHSRGFTLMEISVALLLAGLLLAVAIPAVQSVAATQLKKSAGQLSGMAREAYARAAISGKPHRIVMDLDEGTFWLESTADFFVLGQEKTRQMTESELAEKAKGGAPKLGELFRTSRSDQDERERLRAQLAQPPQWSAVDDELGQPQKLPSDCVFEKVWVSHQSEAFTRGVSHLHFWPSGRAQSAVIRLSDDPENFSRVISVKVNGLTGRTMIQDRALEIPTS